MERARPQGGSGGQRSKKKARAPASVPSNPGAVGAGNETIRYAKVGALAPLSLSFLLLSPARLPS
jgi:hypothetical protein